jgi:hypothetical protein
LYVAANFPQLTENISNWEEPLLKKNKTTTTTKTLQYCIDIELIKI